jgi:hypothetical protein
LKAEDGNAHYMCTKINEREWQKIKME